MDFLGCVLATHQSVSPKGGFICEGALTEAAHIGLLSRVDALVPLERVQLGELFIAVFTAVRSLTCNNRKVVFPSGE